jgi:hypothetical protein
VASSGYPCYRNILTALGCEVLTVPVNKDFKVTAKELAETSKSLWESRQKKPKVGDVVGGMLCSYITSRRPVGSCVLRLTPTDRFSSSPWFRLLRA